MLKWFTFILHAILSSTSLLKQAESHSSVGSVADLRKGGRWLDTWLGQYSFRGLIIVTATGFIPLSPLSIGLSGKAASGLERILCTGKNNYF